MTNRCFLYAKNIKIRDGGIVKTKIFSCISILVLLLSCILLSSCSNEETQKSVPVDITIQGVENSNRITVYVINTSTKEKTKIQAKERNKYFCSTTLDCGTYTVEKVKSNDSDYELDVLTKQFTIKEGIQEEIEIKVIEKDISWTFRWFWRKNGFTIVALGIAITALVIIKVRKAHKENQSHSGLE